MKPEKPTPKKQTAAQKAKAARSLAVSKLSAAGFNGPQIEALLAIFKAA